MSERVQLKGCICEPCSDISTSWSDMRGKFGYTTVGDMANIIYKEE
jgi:hypothetical protein